MRRLSAQHDERLKGKTEEHAVALNDLVRTHSGVVQRLTEEVDPKNAALEGLQRSVLEHSRKDLVFVSDKPLSLGSPPITPLPSRVELPQLSAGATSIFTAGTSITPPSLPAVEFVTAAFDDIVTTLPQGTSEFDPSADTPVLENHVEKELANGEASATPETWINEPLSFNFAVSVSDTYNMVGRWTMVNRTFPDLSPVNGPILKKGCWGTRLLERGRRNQPTEESARHSNSVPVSRIFATGTPVAAAEAQASSRNLEASAGKELPSGGFISASELITPTVRLKSNTLSVNGTTSAATRGQQALELPKVPVVATANPRAFPKSDGAWVGVLANGPQPHLPPGARKFRALPQNFSGRRLHLPPTGQPTIQAFPPSMAPTSALAGPLHVPLLVHPQAILTSTPVIHMGPTDSNLRPRRASPLSLGSRGTLQPPPLKTSTQPIASTSALPAQPA